MKDRLCYCFASYRRLVRGISIARCFFLCKLNVSFSESYKFCQAFLTAVKKSAVSCVKLIYLATRHFLKHPCWLYLYHEIELTGRYAGHQVAPAESFGHLPKPLSPLFFRRSWFKKLPHLCLTITEKWHMILPD